MSRLLALLLILLSACAGCLPQLPQNAKPDGPQRSILYETAGGSFEQEQGLDDALWLEVKHRGEDRTFGGYLSRNNARLAAIVLILDGASTFEPDGGVGSARRWHQTVARPLQEAGYLTWCLVTHECGTPYGQDDLADVRDAVDWLYGDGKAVLGIERVYILGYSAGGTLAVLINRERRVSAIVEVSGLTQPDSLEYRQDFWRPVTSLYPLNVGACQMLDTINYYGSPGSAGWNTFDTVGRIEELKSPMLVIHGEVDDIFEVSNATALQTRYNEAVAAGQTLPLLQFLILPGGGHFLDLTASGIMSSVLDFFAVHSAEP